MRRVLPLLCACLLLAGFAWPDGGDALGRRLVAPGGVSPLLPGARIEQAIARLPHREGHVATSAGVELFWRAFDPGAYRLDYAYRPDGSERGRMDFSLDFAVPDAAPVAPRGTVLLLHGWMMDGGSLLPWSLQLAQAGYRTISLDLRNHGRSGAAPSGYGLREARDVADAVAALRERGEIVGPLHVMGVSYGAATAIFSARELGLQVENVVAIESFDNAGRAIRDMVPHLLHKAPESLAQQFTHRWLRWQLDDAALERAIAGASQTLRLPLDGVDVGTALAQVPGCVLLLHGSDDAHVPVAHGRALAAAAPRARYIEVPGEDHISLPMRLDLLAPTVIDWLDNASPARHCPPPLALSDPANQRNA
ncbi:alpha/beta fold hydrolase [Luteimonas viscosa]|nr:alpha/beta fold hydrolase [Luteimonas viscosa]